MNGHNDTKGKARSRSLALGVFLIVVAVAAVLVGRFVMPNANLRSLNPFAGLSTTTVTGVIGSEKREYFEDPNVVKRLKQLGYEVNFTTAGSRKIAEQIDVTELDFAFPSSAPAAEKVARQNSNYSVTQPFYSPMTVATFQPIVDILTREGVVSEQNGMNVIDMGAFIDLADANTRWRDLGSEFPSPRTVQVSTTDIRTSNSAAMYLSILAWEFADKDPDRANDLDHLVQRITPYFAGQGYTASTSAGPFADYLSQGMGAAPMVLVYEAQFLGEQMKPNSRIKDSMVLLYPDPTVLATHSVVGISDNGKGFAETLANDEKLQELAAQHGFRPSNSGAFGPVMADNGLHPPEEYFATVDPPPYDKLERLITEVGKAYTDPPTTDEEE
ncbi:hypothetical protein QP027_05135 [Corynebacterium breve]|uniref:Extracellular solute-binding protein n=1 Tax=Corynebacterium breve TaxID=3049799 RepID=A0ABY8VHG1_9CORY|nr:hypothetical protein [Corynebacterium breve]WIM68772.1 hypothetical protein QP027_05135 [Corynebacterium breve]